MNVRAYFSYMSQTAVHGYVYKCNDGNDSPSRFCSDKSLLILYHLLHESLKYFQRQVFLLEQI